MVKKSAINKIC